MVRFSVIIRLSLMSCCRSNSAASKASIVFWLNLTADGQRTKLIQFQSSRNWGVVFVEVDNTQGSKDRCLVAHYLNVYDGVSAI